MSTVLVLASIHFLVDGFGNIFAPLLPLLIPRLHLSLAAVGTLQMCFQIATSVAQLGFGHIADQWRPRVLLIAGPIVALTILPIVGLSTSVWMLAAVLVVGGLGGAAFHPPAAAVVGRVSGERQGFAMAIHITGGSMGTALAPLAFAPAVQYYGLSAAPLFIVPALLALSFLLRSIPRLERMQEHHEHRGFAALKPYAQPLTLLYFIVVLRTLTATSFATFVPVMLTRRGMSVTQAGFAVAAYLFASSVGGFLGGPLADRFGARIIILWSLASSVPFLAIAPWLSGWTLVAVLALGGFLLQSTLPVNVTFAQMIAPISAATVSSLMMGFAWGSGGLSVPLVGMVADRIGIEQALSLVSAAPFVAAALAVPLPDGKRVHTPLRASPVTTSEITGTDVAPDA
jgi:FSR family fosmidomycin resistance protein-like MFS transporter